MSDRRKHQSRGLAIAHEGLQSREISRVLDLGSAVGSNVGFFSRYDVQLTIADLRAAIRGDDISADIDGVLRLENALPSYDLVLGWDLLDYLERERRERFGKRLVELSHPGTQLLCLVTYREQMPASPRVFRLQGDDTIVFDDPVETERPSPRLQEPDLVRMLGGFEVEVGSLLQNGIKEYLLERTDHASTLRALPQEGQVRRR